MCQLEMCSDEIKPKQWLKQVRNVFDSHNKSFDSHNKVGNDSTGLSGASIFSLSIVSVFYDKRHVCFLSPGSYLEIRSLPMQSR